MTTILATLAMTTIVRVAAQGGAPFVVIDAGAEQGVRVGDFVCFSTKTDAGSGGIDADRICGIVASVRPTAAGVRLDNEHTGALTNGMDATVLPRDATPPVTTEPPAKEPEELLATTDPLQDLARAPPPADESAKSAVLASTGPPLRKRVAAHYLYDLAHPVIYSAVAFDGVAIGGTGPTPPWISSRDIDVAALGGAFAYHHPLGQDVELITTLLYFLREEISSTTIFTSGSQRGEILTVTKGRTSGLAVDGQWRLLSGSSWDAFAGTGLSILNSSVDVEAQLTRTSGRQKIATYESFLYVLCADAVAAFDYRLGSLSLKASLRLTLPVATLLQGNSGDIDFSTADVGNADYKLTLLDGAVRHRPAAFGAVLGLGAGWNF